MKPIAGLIKCSFQTIVPLPDNCYENIKYINITWQLFDVTDPWVFAKLSPFFWFKTTKMQISFLLHIIFSLSFNFAYFTDLVQNIWEAEGQQSPHLRQGGSAHDRLQPITCYQLLS